MDYWVIETDYTSYTVAYGCDNITESGTCREGHIWGFTRNFTQKADLRTQMKAVAAKAGVLENEIIDTPQIESQYISWAIPANTLEQ